MTIAKRVLLFAALLFSAAGPVWAILERTKNNVVTPQVNL